MALRHSLFKAELKTHYPSGRTSANICLSVSSIKTDTRRIMRPDELSLIVLRSRGISQDGSSRRIMRIVFVFILETHNHANYKCLPRFQTDNAC